MAQNPELGCGNDAPWEPWKSPTPTFPPSPPRWEPPHRTRNPHIPPATTAAGTVYPRRPNPPKSRVPSDSCVEREKLAKLGLKVTNGTCKGKAIGIVGGVRGPKRES